MMDSDRATLPGTERTMPRDATLAGSIDANERTQVTVVVRPRTPPGPAAQALAAQPMAQRNYLDRATFVAEHGASPEDLAAVEGFARQAGLDVVETSAGRRSVVVAGPLAKLVAAFGADVRMVSAGGDTFRTRVGTLSVPRTLAGVVVGVFGLDQRPQARAQFRWAIRPARAATPGYAPPQLARAYDFPTGVDGTGQTIALIELGGGYVAADLDTYFGGLQIATPSVTAVAVDGAGNAPAGTPQSADGEVMLDIEVAGSIAPGAKIVVYFAPNTDQGFLDAITTAIHDTTNKPTVVSISWGGPESSWTQQATQNFDAAFADAAMLGVTVLVAAGDNGSSDGVTDGAAHVDFPASSPHVTACGGTRLTLNGTAIASESVWNDGAAGGATGGGVSDVFPVPDWQTHANVPPSVNAGGRVGRGVPDVAGDADPQTGYTIRVDGSDGVVGGTSAVAPLWAALVALGNQRLGKPLGFINPGLYANAASLRDITSGNNGAYAAKAGWDACTGLGSPDGAKVVAALTTATAPTPPA